MSESTSLSSDAAEMRDMSTYFSYLTVLKSKDPEISDASRVKCIVEISKGLTAIVEHPNYHDFLKEAITTFLTVFRERDVHFISDNPLQQLRKWLLEIINRLPPSNYLHEFVYSILDLMFDLLQKENEENMLVCIRIIIEFHRSYKTAFRPKISEFLHCIGEMFCNLRDNLDQILKPKSSVMLHDQSMESLNVALEYIYTTTTVQIQGVEKTSNLIPRATRSLKILIELPYVVILMHQKYEKIVEKEVQEFIKLFIETLTLEPQMDIGQLMKSNNEVFMDYMAAQISVLSFLSHMFLSVYDISNYKSEDLMKGMIRLFRLCPHEVIHFRKNLLFAAKLLLTSNLKERFINSLDDFLDEGVLIGYGWSSYEILRPSAHNMVANFMMDVRHSLSLVHLEKSVLALSRLLHDESLHIVLQTQLCDLLVKLVECVENKTKQEPAKGEVIIRMILEVFILKFKSVAKSQLLHLVAKWKDPSTRQQQINSLQCNKNLSSKIDMKEDLKSLPNFSANYLHSKEEPKPKFGFPPVQCGTYSVADCRKLMNSLITGVMTVLWGNTRKKMDSNQGSQKIYGLYGRKGKHSTFEPLIFIRLLRNVFKVYSVSFLTLPPPLRRPQPVLAARSQMDKDILQLFAEIFIALDPKVFKNVMGISMDFIIDSISCNYALQITAKSFLAHSYTSPIFGTVFLECLITRMKFIDTNSDLSKLYLELFKLVFQSVSWFEQNELMLKPYVGCIVNKSIELAITAKEPQNYLLLLSSLFDIIGNDYHDLLFMEFLNFLPKLLQDLNRLMSHHHKPYLNFMFVHLSLSVPVKLSSLLLYLPLLMQPLVTALNGTDVSVFEGVATLEACTHSFQPFVYRSLEPVWAELMQALWKTLRDNNKENAKNVFAILGMFGGMNRQRMVEPQKVELDTTVKHLSIKVDFAMTNQEKENKTIFLPVAKIIETACTLLETADVESYYLEYCWVVLKGFLSCIVVHSDCQTGWEGQTGMLKPMPFEYKQNPLVTPFYKCVDEASRNVVKKALFGMFVAASKPKLMKEVLPFLIGLVHHYTAVLVEQQCNTSKNVDMLGEQQCNSPTGMDPLVLVDAVVDVLANDGLEQYEIGIFTVKLIIDVACVIMASERKVYQLPLIDYVFEKMCSLCYERAPHKKHGGLLIMQYLVDTMPIGWLLSWAHRFVKVLFLVLPDLVGTVSQKTVALAGNILDKILEKCGSQDEKIYEKEINNITRELIHHLVSPVADFRQKVKESLSVFATASGKTVADLFDLHLKKELILPSNSLLKKSQGCQTAILDAVAFCLQLSDESDTKFFELSLEIPENQSLLQDLKTICDKDDSTLQSQFSCYKLATDFRSLRKAAMKVLVWFYKYKDEQKDVFMLLCKNFHDTNDSDIKETACACLKEVVKSPHCDVKTIHWDFLPTVMNLHGYNDLTCHNLPKSTIISNLSYLTSIFSISLHEPRFEELLQHYYKAMNLIRSKDNETEGMKLFASITNILRQIHNNNTQDCLNTMLDFFLNVGSMALFRHNSVLREPVFKFFGCFADRTVNYLITAKFQNDWSRKLLKNLVHDPDEGSKFQLALQEMYPSLIDMANYFHKLTSPVELSNPTLQCCKAAIHALYLLARVNSPWFVQKTDLVTCLRNIWLSDTMIHLQDQLDIVEFHQLQLPKMLVWCLLMYFRNNTSDIKMLFQLIRICSGRYISNFEFLRDFLENTVAATYSEEWKRDAFFTFADVFHDHSCSQELKAKIIQYVIIPCFAVSFKEGKMKALISGNKPLKFDQERNVIIVLINDIIGKSENVVHSDSTRMLLLQLSCLLVENAYDYIPASKCKDSKLKMLMTFAWPCLLTNNCVDPATKYHGHLLLATIIHKFPIQKRIVLRVFHGLLKAHVTEARSVVQQALDILTPMIPTRTHDKDDMLLYWTKKIMVEEGHVLPQLTHVLQLVVRHHKVYKQVRHHLIPAMVSSIKRLASISKFQLEHKKVAVDVADVIISWELDRIQEIDTENTDPKCSMNPSTSTHQDISEQQSSTTTLVSKSSEDQSNKPLEKDLSDVIVNSLFRITCEAETTNPKCPMIPSTSTHQDISEQKSSKTTLLSKSSEDQSNKPLEKKLSDVIVNSLFRITCEINDANVASSGIMSPDAFRRMCITSVKMALTSYLWADCALDLSWMNELLNTLDSPDPNNGNICTSLELLALAIEVRKDPHALVPMLGQLQPCISKCMRCPNSKVTQSVQCLLTQLMKSFPMDSVLQDECYDNGLKQLYIDINNFIISGLQSFASLNASSTDSSSAGELSRTLVVLRAVCTNDPIYMDKVLEPFFQCLQKLQNDHLPPKKIAKDVVLINTDLLIDGLKLITNRVGLLMPQHMKFFVKTILLGLMEKSTDSRVFETIIGMIEEWIKVEDEKILPPPTEDIVTTLLKLLECIEKSFATSSKLNRQFLDLVYSVFSVKKALNVELLQKLKPAFAAGLRCIQPDIRLKFFSLLNHEVQCELFTRLSFIVDSEYWKSMGKYFWIKPCIQLLLAMTHKDEVVRCATSGVLLPCLTSTEDSKKSSVLLGDGDGRPIQEFPYTHEAMDVDVGVDDATNVENTEEPMQLFESLTSSYLLERSNSDFGEEKYWLMQKQARLQTTHNFMTTVQQQRTYDFLKGATELCYHSNNLAHQVWIHLYPQTWEILQEYQQKTLTEKTEAFLCNSDISCQRDYRPCASASFAESFLLCSPVLSPQTLKFLGETYNLWHQVQLLLEELSFKNAAATPSIIKDNYAVSNEEALNVLADMYSQLKEEDIWAGIWQKSHKYHNLATAITYEQQGCFIDAQLEYKKLMEQCDKDILLNPVLPVQAQLQRIHKVLVEHSIRCAKELSEWETLVELGNLRENPDPHLVLENAWKIPNWELMKNTLQHIEGNSHNQPLSWKTELYKSIVSVYRPPIDSDLSFVKDRISHASDICIQEWCRLPRFVSQIHLPLLQTAQQLTEVKDAATLQDFLRKGNFLHAKAIAKKWSYRSPILIDDLSHWAEVFAWRREQYNDLDAKCSAYDSDQLWLGKTDIKNARVARAHGLPQVALSILNGVKDSTQFSILSFERLRQQLKCYLHLGLTSNIEQMKEDSFEEGLVLIRDTDMTCYSAEMRSEVSAYQGTLLDLCGHEEEAKTSFEHAISYHPDVTKTWKMFGDFCEKVFIRNPHEFSDFGEYAITSFINSCRQQNEGRSRKYLPRVLWLLTYDDHTCHLAKVFKKYVFNVASVVWVPWIPQLLTYITCKEGSCLENLLCQIGLMFPQALYFPLQSLQQTLNADLQAKGQLSVEMTGALTLCNQVLNFMHINHPTALSALTNMAEEFARFRENPYEETLAQLRRILTQCFVNVHSSVDRSSGKHSQSPEHSLNANLAVIPVPPAICSLVDTMVNKFVTNDKLNHYHRTKDSTGRKRTPKPNTVHQSWCKNLIADFNFNQRESQKMLKLITNLQKWIEIFEAKTKLMPKFLVLEKRCRFLSHFCEMHADLEMPGEYLIPRENNIYTKIAGFMPKVEIVEKYGVATRRLFIRGHNGLIYPYLLVSDDQPETMRQQERVLQLLWNLNFYLNKQKETQRRCLNFTVPRVVPVNSHMRLVQDYVKSTSLFDIYTQHCRNIANMPEAPLLQYYSSLTALMVKGVPVTPKELKDIFDTVQQAYIPSTVFKNWAVHTYGTATDYWAFRKQVTLQHSLVSLSEYVFHLSCLDPKMMFFHETGSVNISYFKFNIKEGTGELDSERPSVPFRLSPNMIEFMTRIGLDGPMTAAMIAAARCFLQPQYKLVSLLRIMLRDEMIIWYRKKLESMDATTKDVDLSKIIILVVKAVNSIMVRLQNIAEISGNNSKVQLLIHAASDEFNISQLHPSSYPWL